MAADAPSPDCVLCRRSVDLPVVRESELWLTVVNRNQNLLGKTFIALRRHEEHVVGLTPAEWADLREEARWVTERVREAFAPDHFNYSFLMNLDRHVHLHVIPRYVDTRELAGVTFADPDYPDAYRRTSDDELVGAAVVDAVARALRTG
jgi:diadenosine tetraphosphate (Ap4A) HIT family hydrolase